MVMTERTERHRAALHNGLAGQGHEGPTTGSTAMAGHHLIDAYLAALARRLPADAVDELADGLTETYLRHRSAGREPGAAAAAAIAEFGEPDVVLAAFVRQAPGRRVARVLMGSGPLVGLSWGAALVLGRAQSWPIPVAARAAFGTVLLAVIVMLVLAMTGRRSYRRTRMAAGAGLGLIGLDGAMLALMVLIAPPFVWPMALAVPASLTRMALTARAMPRLLAR